MTQQLPTEAGWYLDKGGTAWVVTDDGSLSELTEREYYPRDTWNPRAHSPFTRLVPLSVEDRTLIADTLRVQADATEQWWSKYRGLDKARKAAPAAQEVSALQALAARIAPDQSSLVSRVQAGGDA